MKDKGNAIPIMTTEPENGKQNQMVIERLGNLQVLILDTSIRTGQLTRTVLSSLGITQNSLARDTEEAAYMLNERLYDLFILEWDAAGPKDGLALSQHIRNEPDGLNRMIPIVMTSQRTSLEEIGMARDAGVNEYLVKPFSSKSVLSRLNAIVDEPRGFVIVNTFTGPCRRRKDDTPEERAKHGKTRIEPTPIPRDMLRGLEADDKPKIIVPDFSLKQKIEALPNKMAGLDALLPKAEAEKRSQDYVQWMLADLGILRQSYKQLQISSEFSVTYIERIRSSCMSIRGRAMSCGYVLAAKVAAQLHDFCQKFYAKDNRQHLIVIEKHIETLAAVLSNRLSGEGGVIGSELFNELVQLVNKAIRL